MNKTAIKNYAIWARVNLIEAAKQRAYQYEITKDNITDAGADVVSGEPLTKEEKEQRMQLIDQINRKGFDQVMEEVAYTWFNRFIALRFMEVNGYLPTKIRVFTDSEGNFKPEILKEALTVDLPVDKARVMELLEKQDNEELYKMLLIAQCNELSNGLPDMFEVISNYTELLFPNNLLKEDSILGEMVNSIPEEDWTDAVQIIGWLYQYYNSELKDETFALLKKNVKISKERIPAATQLFTPDWIVRYMVENSLGRLWYEGHPNTEIKKEWKYYLDEAPQEPEVEEQLKAIREEYKTIKPEDIKVIDPCMGSGHILVYAFDVLMQIYTSAGWSERDAAESILENNLYGLDIDDRAGQLAYFAVMMKARKYSRRILTKNIRPKVFSIQESNNVKIEAWWRLGPEEDIARRLVQDLTDAKEYGSIINLSVTPVELQALMKRLDDIEEMSDQGNLLDVIQSDEITRQLYPLVELAEVMVQKYDVVVTNPPYMGNGNMNEKLSSYTKKYYPDYKSDLFSVFIIRCLEMNKLLGYTAYLSPYVWMFIQSYEALRNRIYNSCDIQTLIQFEYSAFEEATVPICTFVVCNNHLDKKGRFIRLSEYRGGMNIQRDKYLEIVNGINKSDCYETAISKLKVIPGIPLAYWVSESLIDAFRNGESLGSIAEPRSGLSTTDNSRFLRLWHEVCLNSIALDVEDTNETLERDEVWCPISKGGDYRKWEGNNEYVVKWYHNGEEIKHAVVNNPKDPNTKSWSRRIFNYQYYFKDCITWSGISSGDFSVRFAKHAIFGSGGKAIFSDEKTLLSLEAFLNSCVSLSFLRFISPTLNYESGHISKLPVLSIKNDSVVIDLVKNCNALSKDDWDSYETSLNYMKNPLI